MRTKTRLFTLIMPVLLGLLTGCNSTNSETQPLTLHYDRPAEFYEEALVIGNGTMGLPFMAGRRKTASN